MTDDHRPAPEAVYVTPAAIVDLLNLLVDTAIARHSTNDETFQECVICGEWEGHTDACPVPAIERFLAV